MTDRQIIAEARRLRAEVEELRATLAELRGRQQESVEYWEAAISHLFPA